MSDNVIPAAPPGASAEPVLGELRSGTAGTPTIIAMVIACAAPITCAVSVIPLAILLGNGVGTPGAILLVTAVLALFAIGFVRIVPFIQNAGAFYAYISAGLGRLTGLTSAYILALAYTALGASIIGGFGYFADNLLERYLGLSVPWPVAGIIGVAISTALAMAGVAVAGRILLIILAVELTAILVLDVAIVVQNGLGSFSFDVFSPSTVFSGAFGVAGIYAFVLFLGFEGTAIYAEEAKSPERSVPRATFWVIALIGAFHVVTSWSMTAATGAENLIPAVAEAPPLFTFGLTDQYVGTGWTDLVMIFNLLSLFAGILAFQNAAARYLFALARDGKLPRVLGRTSAGTGSPSTALISIGVVYVVLTLVYWVSGLDPVLEMGTSLIGMGTIGLVAMLMIASLSIALFFYRRGEISFARVVAPVLAAVLLAACTVAGIQNYGSLTGKITSWANHLPWLYVVVTVAGLGYAVWLRSNRPESYEQIGTTRV